MPRSIPSWLTEGFLSVQAAEGAGVRRGFCTLETPDNIARRLDPAMADRLEGQGIRFVIMSGVMGAGMRNARELVEANKPLSAALKKKGIRRVFYTQSIGTIFYEPFFAERPEAVDWIQRTPSGEIPTYYTLWFRYIPCISNDAFVGFVKELFSYVMTELDLDGIFTDNYGYYSYSCGCPHCVRKFRAYLDAKYPTPEARMARFEFDTPFDFVTPPPFKTLGLFSAHTGIPEPNQILDPVAQEWVRFRSEMIGRLTRELDAVIKGCNPQAIFFVNYVYGGTPGMNCTLFHGLWPEKVYPSCDLVSAEVAGPPSLNEGGVAQGRTLLMKVAKGFGIPLSTCTFDRPLAEFKRIFLAEGYAFNTAPVDLTGDIMRDDPPGWMRDYMQFDSRNRGLFGGASTVADMAVLHSFETLSFTCTYPHESLVLCEQSLLCGRFTFDTVFDSALDHLEAHRALFLANVVSMSRERAERIAAWVRAGGGLVITEDSSALNENMLPWKGEWLAPRKSRILADLLGIDWPLSGTRFAAVGKGRVAAVARVERPWKTGERRDESDQTRAASPLSYAGHSYGPTLPMLLKIPALAVNHAEILSAVDYALGGDRTVRLRADGPVITEVTRNTNGLFVHLLNWDEDSPVDNTAVSVRTPEGMVVKSARLLSPDREVAGGALRFELRAGRAELVVPRLVCYDVVHLG